MPCCFGSLLSLLFISDLTIHDNVVTELVTILARSPAGPMIGLLSQLGQIAAIDPHLPYLAA